MGSELRRLQSRAVLWTLLTAFAAGQLSQTEVEPEFLAPLDNLTVTQGRDVVFTCIVNHLGPYKVAWIKSDSKAILAIHTHLVAHNPRLGVTHNGHNTWKLHISDVQKNDSGTYMCQINTDPMRSQMGHLEIVVPPDILNDESSSDGVSLEGGSIKLRCSAVGTPEPSVQWRREDSRSIVLRPEGGREKIVERSVNGENLVLNNVQRSDMGAYLCIASNGIPPSVSKRFIVQVHFQPVVEAATQIVAAPLGSEVTLQCYVEASPRALNSWYKEMGEKLLEGPKYSMDQQPISEYALVMNLTIRAIERKDLGSYVCSSANALGNANSAVHLHERYMPATTTSPPSHVLHTTHHKPTHAPKKPRPKPKKTEWSTTTAEAPHRAQTINPSVTRTPFWYEETDNSIGAASVTLLSLPLAAFTLAAATISSSWQVS